ncbi:MAG: hypothetical protein Q9169_003710 [Polycauliona sp. 2 TL-2023]
MPRWKVSRSSIAAKKKFVKEEHAREEHKISDQAKDRKSTPESVKRGKADEKQHGEDSNLEPEGHGKAAQNHKEESSLRPESVIEYNSDSEIIEDYFISDSEYFSCDEHPSKNAAAKKDGESGTGSAKQ